MLGAWINIIEPIVNFHLSLQCGKPHGCMWSQEYLRPLDHGHLTLIESMLEMGFKISMYKGFLHIDRI
jgi:hypothetical protein